ncbi:MAG TPA: RNA 3'-terminal phosphate cyclase [Myxococcales bacterium]|jgi:RNA 3'-terminal phosphate cyclase (ATP)
MIVIDGSSGEGGGQIVRTSLALSLCTGKAFRIEKVRAGRAKPGLMRQHLTAVEAAQAIGAAQVKGAAVRSTALGFTPTAVKPGAYTFSIGTAGSATLVLQTVLPALLTASGPSTLVLEGGTHNPLAPPYDFLARCFLPLVAAMGPRITATLQQPGFYPAGGGRFTVEITPAAKLSPLELCERGEIKRRLARALVAHLPETIAHRELKVVKDELGWTGDELRAEEIPRSRGPGNLLLLELESARLTEVVTAFGEKGVASEAVARKAVAEARRYLDAGVPVGEHLADQLMIPLALAGGGRFRTLPLSLHARTQIDVIGRFLDVAIRTREVERDVVEVSVG